MYLILYSNHADKNMLCCAVCCDQVILIASPPALREDYHPSTATDNLESQSNTFNAAASRAVGTIPVTNGSTRNSPPLSYSGSRRSLYGLADTFEPSNTGIADTNRIAFAGASLAAAMLQQAPMGGVGGSNTTSGSTTSGGGTGGGSNIPTGMGLGIELKRVGQGLTGANLTKTGFDDLSPLTFPLEAVSACAVDACMHSWDG